MKDIELAGRRSIRRSCQGSMIVVFAGFTSILVLIGLAALLISKALGGAHETQNAADAGNLNVAKQVVASVGVPLLTDEERSLFGDLVEKNRNITLRSYNRVVARAMYIGLKAKQLGTPEALEHARRALELAQTGTASIGHRLIAKLTEAQTVQPAFDELAKSNSWRMCGSEERSFDSQAFATGYVDAGEAANVFVDPRTARNLPESSVVKIKVNGTNRNFLKGYQDIDIGSGLHYVFVPVGPLQGPHLISERELQTHTTSQFSDLVPPNAFRSGMTAVVSGAVGGQGNVQLSVHACSTVGTLKSIYPMADGLFIRIVNPHGYSGPPAVVELTSIFNHELMAGISVANTAEGKTAVFTTDPQALSKLVAHNNDATQPMPPLVDSLGNTVFFNADGAKATETQLATAKALGPVVTDLDSTTYPTLIPAFAAAYPPRVINSRSHGHILMCLEKYNGNIHEAFAQLCQFPLNTGVCATLYPPGATGLRVFDRGFKYNLNAQDHLGFKISQPGTVPELLEHVGQGAPNLMAPLLEAVQAMAPEVDENQLRALLASTRHELGTTYYLYKDRNSGQLVLNETAPLPNARSARPDGRLHACTHTYHTLGYTVNPYIVMNVPHRMFNIDPPSVVGTDQARWTSSTGFNGLVGDLRFTNQVTGGGTFCSPN